MNEKEIVKLFRSGLDKYQIAIMYKRYVKRFEHRFITKRQALAYVEPFICIEVMSWNNSREALEKIRTKLFRLL